VTSTSSRSPSAVLRFVMRVTMIDSGYVGLISGACFADFGHQVTCVDKDAAKIARLRAGEIPLFAPDLDRLVAVNMGERRLERGRCCV
jgi:UDPglucose 6-dehydrogenase